MVLMKMSDISNEARPLEVATPWLDCLLTEFFNQVFGPVFSPVLISVVPGTLTVVSTCARLAFACLIHRFHFHLSLFFCVWCDCVESRHCQLSVVCCLSQCADIIAALPLFRWYRTAPTLSAPYFIFFKLLLVAVRCKVMLGIRFFR